MLQMDPVRVPLQSPGSRSAPWVGSGGRQDEPCFEPIPRAAVRGYTASLTLGFGVRRFQRQDGETSQRREVPPRVPFSAPRVRRGSSFVARVALQPDGPKWQRVVVKRERFIRQHKDGAKEVLFWLLDKRDAHPTFVSTAMCRISWPNPWSRPPCRLGRPNSCGPRAQRSM